MGQRPSDTSSRDNGSSPSAMDSDSRIRRHTPVGAQVVCSLVDAILVDAPLVVAIPGDVTPVVDRSVGGQAG